RLVHRAWCLLHVGEDEDGHDERRRGTRDGGHSRTTGNEPPQQQPHQSGRRRQCGDEPGPVRCPVRHWMTATSSVLSTSVLANTGSRSASSVRLSTATVSRSRKTASTIARPTPTSAAAMTTTNSAKDWPACSWSRHQASKATKSRLAALNISSTAIKTA